MLREFTEVKQERGAGRRRWFESDGFELIVWHLPTGEVEGFQICYDVGQGDHALTWRAGQGFSHSAIDAGEDVPLRKCTPILIPDGAVPWDRLCAMFEARSASLDESLRELVRAALFRRRGRV